MASNHQVVQCSRLKEIALPAGKKQPTHSGSVCETNVLVKCVFSMCIYIYKSVSVQIHVFVYRLSSVCVHSIKVFSSQSRSKPSSSVDAAVKSQCQRVRRE